MIGLRFTIAIKRGQVFVSDRSYARFLVELKHQADNRWRKNLIEGEG